MSENTQATEVVINAPKTTERVNRVVAEQLGLEIAEGMEHKLFIEDLGADSLDTVELVMALEDELSIEISDDDAEPLLKGTDVVAYLVKRDAKFAQ